MNAEPLPTANAALCESCIRIFTGSWIPWRVPASADGRWGIYEFHKTLQDLRDCVSTHRCPVCKIALERGGWGGAGGGAEPTFAHMAREPYLSINITPNGGTSVLAGCCFVTLERGAFFSSHPAARLLISRLTLQQRSSHCWGQAAPTCRLLRANQADWERGGGVLLSTLPTTFRQAIGVARFLGIPYVWIDSLCIVQDSAADWEVESAAMAKVYGHALVNMAAASSSDSRGGLFFDRDPDVIQPFTVYTPGRGTLGEGWYTWKDNRRWSRLGEEPLHRRGWVLQERLLSPRTIHFAKSEIVWHCLEDVGSESILTRIPDRSVVSPRPAAAGQINDYTDIRTTTAEMMLTLGGMAESRAQRQQRERDWMLLIAQYTRCGLTQASDKLVAVFGIVDRLEQLTGDQCLAGLWRSQMPACLLWLVSWGLADPDGHVKAPPPHDAAQGQPARWTAPSWSWASHSYPVGHVRYEGDSAVCHVEVVGSSVVRRQNGSAVCGKLVLRGPVVEIDVGLVRGQIASRECEGTLLGRWQVSCLVRTDGPYDSACPARALLVMQDCAYMFLLIAPLDPAETEPLSFRRVGVLVMFTETPAGDPGRAEELLSPSKEDGKSRWSEYVKLIELV